MCLDGKTSVFLEQDLTLKRKLNLEEAKSTFLSFRRSPEDVGQRFTPHVVCKVSTVFLLCFSFFMSEPCFEIIPFSGTACETLTTIVM